MSARPRPEVWPLLLGWLRRVRACPAAAPLLLRGSVVTRTLCGDAARPVADVDYLVSGAFDVDAAASLVAEVAALPDADTALILRGTEVIWAETLFPGLRAHLAGSVKGEPELAFQVDLAYGDPLSQPPVWMGIPGVGPVLACPPETLWAWKLHGLTEFGPGRWRAKDLYDLALLGQYVPLDGAALRGAVALAFASRDADLSALHDFRTREGWGCASSSGRKWRAFQKRYGVEADFLEVRGAVRALVERTLGAEERPSECGRPYVPVLSGSSRV